MPKYRMAQYLWDNIIILFLGIAAVVAFPVFGLSAVVEFGWCNIGETSCIMGKGLALAFGITAGLVALVFLFAFLADIIVTRGKQAHRGWITPNPKNLKLYSGRLDEHGVLDLTIHNKETRKPHATINAAYAMHKAHGRKSRLSKIAFELEKRKTRTVSFIREYKSGDFRIAEHFDGGGLETKDSPPYTFGKSEFIVMIVFGFGGSQNEHTNCYNVIVDYVKLHEIRVSIKPIECGTG